MAKTTTPRVAKGPADLKALIKRNGGAVNVAAKARVGYATVYRLTQGTVPGELQLWAIATVLGMTPDQLRALATRAA